MKILIVGDVHFRTTQPISRLGNISEDFENKFLQIREIIVAKSVDYVIVTGDIFHRAKTNNEALLLAKKCFEQLEIPIYSVIGNHDMIGNTITEHRNSSFELLDLLVDNFSILGDRIIGKDGENVNVIGNNYGVNDFTLGLKKYDNFINIGVFHSMITEGPTMFDSINAHEINTEYDIVISGHNHNKVFVNYDNKIVYNPGALMRLTAVKEDRERQVSVGLLTVLDNKYSIDEILLKITPEEDVFDIKEDNKKQEILTEKIVSILNDHIGKIQSVDDIINTIATSEKISSNIVALAKSYIV